MTSGITKKLIAALLISLLSVCAFIVQGYHLGAEDSEVYLPAIKQTVHPALYPERAQFFRMHESLSYFAPFVGILHHLLHVQIDTVVCFVHFICIFLLLAAGKQTAELLFTMEKSRWAAVGLLALTLSVPVAGTALPIADEYLTARSLSTPLTLFAFVYLLRGRTLTAICFLFLASLVHPLMTVFAAGLLVCFLVQQRFAGAVKLVLVRAATFLFPSTVEHFSLRPATGTFRDLLYARNFLIISLWRWWEWVGAAAPLGILYGLSRLPLRSVTNKFRPAAQALAVFGAIATAVAFLFASSPDFDNYERLQVMRSFHLIYIIFFLICGGLLAEYVLQKHVWRWLLLFIPLAAGMFALNRSLYPASPHIELPGRATANPWIESFYWVRANTPTDALFALNPRYMELPGEDRHGFRAIAERSRLADYDKDSGAVTMFPQLLPAWEHDQQLLAGWNSFKLADFKRLREEAGVRWVLLERPVAGLPCPYTNQTVRVCEIPAP